MKNIKFYGGPMHGRTECVSDHLLHGRRYEVRERTFRAPVSSHFHDSPLSAPLRVDTTTYYFKVYTLPATTMEMARVRKDTTVAVLEGADLTHRERYDMENDMEKLSWEWCEEPSFLRDFEAWWEKQLHVRGVKKVCVRW